MNPLHGKVPIELDRTRHIMFSLNLLIDLEDEIGDLSNLGEKMAGIGNLKFIRNLLTRTLNEGASEGEEPITEEQVGKLIHMGNIKLVTNAIGEAYSLAVRGEPTPAEGGETDPIASDSPDDQETNDGEEVPN